MPQPPAAAHNPRRVVFFDREEKVSAWLNHHTFGAYPIRPMPENHLRDKVLGYVGGSPTDEHTYMELYRTSLGASFFHTDGNPYDGIPERLKADGIDIVRPIWVDTREEPFLLTRRLNVRFRQGVELDQVTELLQELPVRQLGFSSSPYLVRLEVLRPGRELALPIANQLAKHPLVALAQPEVCFLPESIQRLPPARAINGAQVDPWFLNVIGARKVWATTQGDPKIVIAVLDEGFTMKVGGSLHPAFKASLAINHAEIPNNGKDDDHNQYCDDYLGWNSDSNSGDLTHPNSQHGNSVASLLVGAQNGKPIGVCPDCLVLPTAIRHNTGSVSKALRFARDRGARVVVGSWGMHQTNAKLVRSVSDEIALLRQGGANIVFAAGNLAKPVRFPARLDTVLAIGASDRHDTSYLSNFARGKKLDLVAPSVYNQDSNNLLVTASLSAQPYHGFFGTSAAAPIVAGVVALLLSIDETLTPDQIEKILKTSAKRIGAKHLFKMLYPNKDSFGRHGDLLGYGRVDAPAALSLLP